MSLIAVKIGPRDHGRRMTLEDFDHAEVVPGYQYELSRGVITVSDIPNPPHGGQVYKIIEQLFAYSIGHPGRIYRIATGSECKIMLGRFQSERHPDIAIYKTPEPAQDSSAWWSWVPEIVIEVVSADSAERDYGEKREEYLAFGVREYWIFDADKREMLVLRNEDGEWSPKTIRPPKLYRTRVLPGLAFDCAAVFADCV